MLFVQTMKLKSVPKQKLKVYILRALENLNRSSSACLPRTNNKTSSTGDICTTTSCLLGWTAKAKIEELKIQIKNQECLLFECKIVHNWKFCFFSVSLKLFTDYETSIWVKHQQLTEAIVEDIVVLILGWPGLLNIYQDNRPILSFRDFHLLN